MKRLCVFCGSSSGGRPEYARVAADFGEALAARGLELVYGGGRVGLMGVLADAALAAGAHVIGVIPRSLVAWEVAHTRLPDLRVVESMHERKALMAELSDGFVAIPGGLGTLEELFEVWTWAQLGLHAKPCGLLDAHDYFRDLRRFIDHAVAEGFLRPEHRAMLLVATAGGELLDAFADYRPPVVEKWIDRTSR
jgi:uncharacterized protein (TIGR00730 family)